MRLTIIGLISNQETKIRDEFKEKFDLTFVSSSEKNNSKKITTSVEGADSVILMTKFAAHGTQDMVRKHPGLVFLNGGVSSLKAKLSSL
jgi:hypothetical protein